jgi:ABC-type lipoprotein export system ATPase subunit
LSTRKRKSRSTRRPCEAELARIGSERFGFAFQGFSLLARGNARESVALRGDRRRGLLSNIAVLEH